MSGRGASDAVATLVMGIGSIVGLMAFGMAASVLWALVIWHLWGWFAVPLGAPILGLAHVWGLMILKGILTFRQPAEGEKQDWLLMITYPLIAWAFGAVAAWWMA